MKKTFIALSSAILLGSFSFAAMAESGVLVDVSSRTGSLPFDLGYSGYVSQTLYTPSQVAAATAGKDMFQIESLQYTLASTPDEGSTNLLVYMYATEDVNLYDNAVAKDDMTPVFEGKVSFSDIKDNKLTILLDTPFVIEAGQGVVVAIESQRIEWANWSFVLGPVEAYQTYTWDRYFWEISEIDWSQLTDSNYYDQPALTIGYGDAIVDEAFKLNATLTAPEVAYLDQPTEFTVNIENNGYEEASGYKVNLLDAGMNVIATTDGVSVAPGASETVTLSYTFQSAGTYTVYAQLVKDEAAIRSKGVTLKAQRAIPAGTAYETLGEGGSTTCELLNGNYEVDASQMLYPASYFEDFLSDIDINSISFFHTGNDYALPAYPVKIWMAQTDQTTGYTRYDDSTLVPEEDFVLVYDGIWQPDKSTEVSFILDNVFTLEKGKGLAVNVAIDGNDGNPMLWYVATSTEENYLAYRYSYSQIADFDIYNQNVYLYATNKLPQAKIGYTAAAVADVIDLAAAAGANWPTEAEAGVAVNFPVTITNEGNVPVAGYTVELLDYTNDFDNPEVIATTEVNRQLNAGATYNARVAYTFEAGGDYFIGARVVAEGDANSDNDATEPDVVSVPLPAVDLRAVSVTGETDVKTNEEYEYTVEVYNGGQERISSFNITLKTEEGTILATETAQAPLMSMSTGYFAIPLTFTEAGTYHILAEVKADDDEDATNDVTPVALTVEVATNMDGIDNILLDAENSEIYNLQGVRVSNVRNLPAGIYIVNGKKVVVK